MADKFIDGNGFVKVLKDRKRELRLCLLFGEEEYYIEQLVKMCRKAFISPGSEDMDLNVIPRDAKVGFEAIEEFSQMPPWMNEKRLIIVRSAALFDKEFDDEAVRILDNIPDSCVVLFVVEKADKKRKITKYLVKNGVAAEVNHFRENELVKIIADSLGKYNISISTDTAVSLINRCDSDMRNIHNELEKIKLYCVETGKSKITFDDLENMCQPDLTASIFAITECFGSGKSDSALKTLDSLLARKEAIQRIRATMFTHMKRLIIARDLNDSRALEREMGFSEKYSANLTRQASRFSLDNLINLYYAAIKSESDIRHGLMEERIALETLIVKASLKQKN